MKIVKTIIFCNILLLVGFIYIESPKILNFYSKDLHVYFFDIGQGDSTLIKVPNQKDNFVIGNFIFDGIYLNKLILIDGGPTRKVNHEISKVLPFWVKHIDIVIVSHAHADHIVGLSNLLESYTFGCVVYDFRDSKSQNLTYAESEFNSKLMIDKNVRLYNSYDLRFESEFLHRCLKSDYSHHAEFPVPNLYNSSLLELFNAYEPRSLNSVNLLNLAGELTKAEMLDIRRKYRDSLNVQSLITIFEYGDLNLFLLGDATNEVQELLLPSILTNIFDLHSKIRILKVPHQGALDSFNPHFIKTINPELAIIFAGKNNRYNHPNQKVVDFYIENNIKILRTDEHGTIRLISDGQFWEVD